MKVSNDSDATQVLDIICDMCGSSSRIGEHFQFAILKASWGQGAVHSGEAYELHLCESCFSIQVSEMKRTRWAGLMFDEEGDALLNDVTYGRVDLKSGRV
ncbi:hypothetical protein [Pseudomonas putida]|uniref:hypothetical protein n=1 Tax=Pseudomonas putida TaxID=303 RepID=UPI0022DDAA98|nr:hypothetical protein [Pseudomonas putida]WBM44747.1 hypothetical protein M2J85_18620 [Pseudomonas putida]